MIKFEIKTKEHNGDKRTWLTYQTEEVSEVLAAFGWEKMSKENLEKLLDGKSHGFQIRTQLRIVNIDEVKAIIENLIA